MTSITSIAWTRRRLRNANMLDFVLRKERATHEVAHFILISATNLGTGHLD